MTIKGSKPTLCHNTRKTEDTENISILNRSNPPLATAVPIGQEIFHECQMAGPIENLDSKIRHRQKFLRPHRVGSDVSLPHAFFQLLSRLNCILCSLFCLFGCSPMLYSLTVIIPIIQCLCWSIDHDHTNGLMLIPTHFI
jgi:hypothetical protein